MNPRLLALASISALDVPAQAAAAQPADPCPAPGFEVTVRGFRAPTGHIRLYLYGDDPAAFLARGRWLQRIEIPIRSTAPVRACLPAPRPGRYAVSVRHDVDGNRQRMDSSDGGGFSNNPRLAFLNPRPALARVLVTAGEGEARPVDIVMNYRFGLTIRPVR